MEEANFEMPSSQTPLKTGPTVMLCDGRYSHLGLSLILKPMKVGIHLVCLPPNTTHILQPLDVGVFWPVKSAWRKVLKLYRRRNRAENVTKNVFPGLIKGIHVYLQLTCNQYLDLLDLLPLTRQLTPPVHQPQIWSLQALGK